MLGTVPGNHLLLVKWWQNLAALNSLFAVLFADKRNVWVSQVALVVKNPPAEAGAAGDAGSVPRLGRSPRIGNGNPLPSNCLENFMDTGAWWATVHGASVRHDWATDHIHIHRNEVFWRLFSPGSQSDPLKATVLCSVSCASPHLAQSKDQCTVQHSLNHMDSTFVCVHAQLYLILCDPMDCSPPGSSVCGLFQARILEWVATSLSRGSSLPWDWTHVSCASCIRRRMFLPLCNLGSPQLWSYWFFSYYIPVQCSSILYQNFSRNLLSVSLFALFPAP